MRYVGIAFDMAFAVGEDQAMLAFWTARLPFAKRVYGAKRQRNCAPGGFRFRRANFVVPIGALAHMQLALNKIDRRSRQTTQFGCSQSGKNRGYH